MSGNDSTAEAADNGTSYPKGRYLTRTAEEYELLFWLVDEKIIKRYDQRSAMGLRLMMESRDAAQNHRQKKKRAGQPVSHTVQNRLTAEELKTDYLHGRSSVDEVRDSLRRNKNAGVIKTCSPTEATFPKTFGELNHERLQAQFPDYTEKCQRFHERLSVIHPNRRRVDIRIPRKWEKEMAGGLKWSVGGLGLYIFICCLFVEKGTNTLKNIGWMNLDAAATFLGLRLDSIRDALEALEDYDVITVLRDRVKDTKTDRPVCYQLAVNLDWDGIPVEPVAEEQATEPPAEASLPAPEAMQAGAPPEQIPDKFTADLEQIPDKFPNPSICKKHSLSYDSRNHNQSLPPEETKPLSLREKTNQALASEENGDGVLCPQGKEKENPDKSFLFRIENRDELLSIPKLKTLFAYAQSQGWFGESHEEWELFVASAIRAYTRGTKNRNTGGFFYTLISRKSCRAYLTNEHLRQARELIKGTAKRKPPKPLLAGDTAMVVTVSKKLQLAPEHPEVFAEVQRMYRHWCKEQHEYALEELQDYRQKFRAWKAEQGEMKQAA